MVDESDQSNNNAKQAASTKNSSTSHSSPASKQTEDADEEAYETANELDMMVINGNNNGLKSQTLDSQAAKNANEILGGVAEIDYKVYGWRWYVLAVTVLLNGSNAFSWIGYAPVANYVDEYYGSQSASNWLSMVFLLCAVPIAFFAMWGARKYGLRSAIILAGVFNGLGAVIRLVSSAPGLEKQHRLIIVILGQAIAAMAYPFIMFLPTKVAAAWFPASQRQLATTLATLSNPLGVLLANVISPQLVTEVWHVLLLNVITFVPSFTGMLLGVIGVRNSEPPTPPSASAAEDSMEFFTGLKKCLKSRNYWLLLLALGGGMGMFNALYTIMQQMLCAQGYYNSFSGLCCILMIVGGIFGAFASGWVVERTKMYQLTLKVAFSVAVVFGLILAQISLHPNLAPLIAICSFLFGFFGLAAYPTGLELGAECTYPVSEITSGGFIVLSGQIQGVIYIMLLSKLAKEKTHDLHLEVCSKVQGLLEGEENKIKAMDMTVPLIVFSAIAAALALGFTIFFRPKLRRLEMEKSMKRNDPVKGTELLESEVTTPHTQTEAVNTPHGIKA